MFVSRFHPIISSSPVDDNGNLIGAIAIQGSKLENFMLNDAGWPRSNLMVAMSASSDAVLRRAFDALTEVKTVSPFAGMSDEQIVNSIFPRYAFTPAEVNSALNYMASRLPSDEPAPAPPQPTLEVPTPTPTVS